MFAAARGLFMGFAGCGAFFARRLRERDNFLAGFLLPLSGGFEDFPDIEIVLSGQLFAKLSDFLDNRISPHNYSPISSTGVQITGHS